MLFAFIDPTDLSQIGFYTSHDTRPGFLEGLGLPTPAIVDEESANTEEFYVTVSSELADRFADVDLFVTYGDADGAIIDQLQADPLLSTIPAIAGGSIAILENSTPLAASANPSPLSIGWGIDDYFALLAGGLQPTDELVGHRRHAVGRCVCAASGRGARRLARRTVLPASGAGCGVGRVRDTGRHVGRHLRCVVRNRRR